MTVENQYPVYPVGTPGTPWGEAERTQWRALQHKKRDYFTDVVSPLLRMAHGEAIQYGELDYTVFGAAKYPLFAIKSKGWSKDKPMVLVTGGVHGYETSGVHGALLFAEKALATYADKVNVLVLPCVSPWGYETVNRWTPLAVDPNRCFTPSAPGCPEAAAAMACAFEHIQQSAGVVMHTDLHETTDTDNSEFTPAKTARDGAPTPAWDPIPDGFYTVGDTLAPVPEFHKAIIDAVSKVTHIADPDEQGNLVGLKPDQPGVVNDDSRALGLCSGFSGAPFAVTTEVYPDSKRTNPEECNRAQYAVITTGIEFVLARQ